MTITDPSPSLMGEPTAEGRFGEFGGRFVPETLMPACLELEAAFREAWSDPGFVGEYRSLLRTYGGRPTPVTACDRLSERLGVTVLLKREDLAHTGSHKINNVLGQALLARRMGKQRVIAETGAGQHGVATATACARLGLDCVVYMGAVDVHRQLVAAEHGERAAGRAAHGETNIAQRDRLTERLDVTSGSPLGVVVHHVHHLPVALPVHHDGGGAGCVGAHHRGG